jgi:hypothetical protein
MAASSVSCNKSSASAGGIVIPYRSRATDYTDLSADIGGTKNLAEEFDLFEVAGAPGTHDQMQSKLQPLPKPERAIH